MKKTALFNALVAILFGGGILVSCDPDQDISGDNNNPPQTTVPGDDSEGDKVRIFTITDSQDSPVTALEFGENAKSHTVSVAANFLWTLSVDQFPEWITAPAEAIQGILNAETGLYEAELALSVDEAEIANNYDNKTASMSFSASDDLDWSAVLELTHTFERPAAPASVLSSALGTTITIDVNGNIVGAEGNTLDFTFTPGEGETDFKAFDVVLLDYGGGTEWKACSEINYEPEHWATLTAKSDDKYTLTISAYPAQYSTNKTLKAYLFFLPSSVYSTWFAPVPGVDDPTRNVWWMAAGGNMVDKFDTGDIMPDYVKYAITINVQQPE